MKYSRAATAGFTLLELLVVLALVGVLTASVLAFVRPGSETARLKLAVSDLETDLRLARSLATEEQKPVVVRLDSAGHFWELGDRRRRKFPVSITISMTASPDDNTASAVSFFPDGSSSGAIIQLRQGGSGSRMIVDWLTGRVRVERAG